MRLFNTLSGVAESFTADHEVKLYVCGVTPYDTTHVGHARTYLVFDVLLRHLLHGRMRVDYIQNITDVDESILQRATDLGQRYEELGDRFAAIYMEDIAALGMIPAASYPRASEAIPEIQEVIRRLLATGHAYRVDGDVFFEVNAAGGFGELSRLPRSAMLDVEAQQDDSTVNDARKHDPLDFPLWRSAAEDGGPSWDSPWGPGRPGWHIECSTLALRHLGKQLDIHGGGSDLVYPHHEAEIAQAEAVTGVRPFARFWVHVAMARLDGEKMSKSGGNMIFVRDLLKIHSSDALRLYLLGTHYREPLDFDNEALERHAALAGRLALAARVEAPRRGEEVVDVAGFRDAFVEALDDDLDTPRAIEILSGLSDVVLEPAGKATFAAQRALRSLAAHLGLSLE